MKNKLTPEQVNKEILDRINKELINTGTANLRKLIYEKPWCTGGKCEQVAVIKLNQNN